MSRSVAVVLAAVAAGFALAGCGVEETLSRQELIAKGDALCTEADRRVEAIAQPTTVAEVGQFVGVLDAMVSDFRALEPPDEDRARVDAMLRDLDRGVTQLGAAYTRAIEAGRDPEGAHLDEAGRLLERARAAARAYGFSVCGHDA